jgi:uncharacterized membrane protein
MRASIATALAGALSLLAACSDTDLPGGTSPDEPVLTPQLSVVTFGMTTIGDPTGGSGALALNELGQILMSQGPRPFRPFVWTNGGLSPLLAPFDAQQVQGFDLNADATAVGDVDGHAAAWVGGALTLLQLEERFTLSQAVAINGAGQIVGVAFVPNEGPTPVLWQDKDQPMTVLPGGFGRLEDINNAGAMVGTSVDVALNFLRGAYWASPTSAPQFLKGPTGQLCGDPQAINDRGEIAGFCNGSAAYWSSPGANAVLLGGESSAREINELGQIIGIALNSQRDIRPTLWQQEGSSFRAFDLGVPAGQDEGGGADLNNHGQAVGSALHEESGIGPVGVGVLWQIPVRVALDVVPGAGTSVKMGGTGTVAAALLGSPWFHAGDIDPGTLTLGNDNGTETPVARKKGAPSTKLIDVNRDGDLDLAAEFDKQAMTRSGDLVTGPQMLIVQGRLRDGTRLRGADQVAGVR